MAKINFYGKCVKFDGNSEISSEFRQFRKLLCMHLVKTLNFYNMLLVARYAPRKNLEKNAYAPKTVQKTSKFRPKTIKNFGQFGNINRDVLFFIKVHYVGQIDLTSVTNLTQYFLRWTSRFVQRKKNVDFTSLFNDKIGQKIH